MVFGLNIQPTMFIYGLTFLLYFLKLSGGIGNGRVYLFAYVNNSVLKTIKKQHQKVENTMTFFLCIMYHSLYTIHFKKASQLDVFDN